MIEVDEPSDALTPARLRSPESDAIVGRRFRAVAIFGIVVAVGVGIGAWTFLADLDRNLTRSLTIGEDAAESLGDTIDVADRVVADLDRGLVTLERTLRTLASTTEGTGAMSDSAAEIAGRLPDSFEGVDRALATVESIATTIDGALSAASRLPLGPDYDPAVPLPDAVADVRAAFEPVGGDLTELAERLDAFAGDTEQLSDDLEGVRAEVERTRASLAASSELLDRYRTTADDARDLAREGRSDLDRSFLLARLSLIAIVLLGIVSQYVPWWLGGRLRPEIDPLARTRTDELRTAEFADRPADV